MGSLTSCMKKAGSALRAEDKAAILAKARELKQSGVAKRDAEIQAIQSRLGEVRQMLADAGGNVPAVAPAPVAAAAAQPEPAHPNARTRRKKAAAAVVEAPTAPKEAAAPVSAPEPVVEAKKTDATEPAAFSRNTDSAEENALKALSKNDSLFQLGRSSAKTLEGVAADISPGIKVEKRATLGSRTNYDLTMQDGTVARLSVRTPNPYGPDLYGYNVVDGEMTDPIMERPGTNPEDVPLTDDVWIDVSQLKGEGDGKKIYAIAANFAHNTGRIFIGDPAGLTDEAMIRRSEQMLSSALKFGTTAHLAPHPRQVQGHPEGGVKPLTWTYGDDLANIRSLIDVNLGALENAGADFITFDPASGQFLDSEGKPLSRDVLKDLAGLPAAIRARAGHSTLARGAILRALLREESAGAGSSDGRSDGLLARLVRLGAVQNGPASNIFYSRQGVGTSAPTARVTEVQRLVSAIAARWANSPKIVVAPGIQSDLVPASVREDDQKQRSQGATGEPEGFLHDGTVYLMADQLRGDADVVRVLMHESVGHFGLRGTFGSELGGILDRMAILNAGRVRDKAKQYGLDYDKPSERRMAAEEVLADMAQRTPELGWVQRAIAAVRTWARANIPGFAAMKLSDAEIVRSFLEPARNFVQRGVGTVRTETAMFSRSMTEKASAIAESVSDLKLPAGYMLGDLFKRAGTISWWDRTVGTPYNLAQKNQAFKRVFDGAQRFGNDVSKFATIAADEASRLLPKLETLRDIAKTPVSAEDSKAISAPIFEGTLLWTRDGHGKPVRVDELVKEAEGMDSETKARELMRRGKLDPNVLKMWQGLPVEQFESIIDGKYERDAMQPGIVWSDDELKSQFKLSDEQISLYKEFRASTDKSLTNLAVTDMLRYGGKDVESVRDAALAAPDVEAASLLLRDHLFKLAAEEKDRADLLNDTANTIISKSDRARDLMTQGYAPLSRFGTHTVYVTRGEEQLYYGMFDSPVQASKMGRMMKEQYPDATVKQGTVSQEEYKLFSGVSPETLELFGDMLGLESQGDSESSKAFQLYLKLAKANRSAMKRLIHRKGVAGFSEDAARVLAAFVYSNARQSSTNLNMGEMTEAANAIPQGSGQLKDAAVKLVNYVKEPQEEASALRGLLFTQYLAGSVAGGLMNASQPFTVTLPYLSQWGGLMKAGGRLKDAVRDAVRSTTGDKELDAALKRASDDGVTSPQEVHQLMAQAQGRSSLRSGDGTVVGDAAAKAANALSKFNVAWGKVFSAAEQFNRKTTYIAAYRTAVEEKIEDPDAFARKAVNETQFVYGKANRPQWARGAIGATLFTFKSYSISYLELLSRMARSGPEGRRAALYAVSILFLMGGADGLPFADDVGDLIDGFLQRLGYNVSSKQARHEFFADLLGDDVGRFVSKGLSGLPGAPIDVSGRLGMGNLIPGTGLLVKKKDSSNDATEVLGPAGDLAKRAGQAVGQLVDGKPLDAAKSIAPRAMSNLIQAWDMASTGMYRDQGGKKVVDATAFEAAMKGLGFQPNAVARLQEAGRATDQIKQTYLVRQSELTHDMERAIFEGDEEAKADVRDAIKRWNADNTTTPIKLNMPSILRQVRLMRMDKAQRLETTAPKAIRQEVRRQLSEAGS